VTVPALPPQTSSYGSGTYRGQYDTAHSRGVQRDSIPGVIAANTVRGPQGEPGTEGEQGVGAQLPEVAVAPLTATVAASNLSGWTTRFSTAVQTLAQPLPPALDGGHSVRVGWSVGVDGTSLSLTANGSDVIGDGSDTTFTFFTVGQVIELQPVGGRWRYVSGQALTSTTAFPHGATSYRPSATSVGIGFQWFDTTLHKPVWSDGTAWRDATGTAV
jgi:hypothetical protein